MESVGTLRERHADRLLYAKNEHVKLYTQNDARRYTRRRRVVMHLLSTVYIESQTLVL